MAVKIKQEQMIVLTYTKPIPKTFGALRYKAIDSIERDEVASFPVYDGKGDVIKHITGQVLTCPVYTEDEEPHLVIKISTEEK